MRCCERLQEREAACEMQVPRQPSGHEFDRRVAANAVISQGVQLRDAAAAAEASRELEVSRWKTRSLVHL